jgi:hypothetical protein
VEFRAALQRYYEIFPEAFQRRIAEQGLWMPFAKISAVPGWQDFGFRFKEGTDETKWDDEHGILTFRYTEPMTWWMPGQSMPALSGNIAERAPTPDATRGPVHQRVPRRIGQYGAQLLDTPWCDGAVWSMNSMPEIAGRSRISGISGTRPACEAVRAGSQRTASTSIRAKDM